MSENGNYDTSRIEAEIDSLTMSVQSVTSELIEIRRLLWAHLVQHSGSWEVAANCYIWGQQGQTKVRQQMQAKGGDA